MGRDGDEDGTITAQGRAEDEDGAGMTFFPNYVINIEKLSPTMLLNLCYNIFGAI